MKRYMYIIFAILAIFIMIVCYRWKDILVYDANYIVKNEKGVLLKAKVYKGVTELNNSQKVPLLMLYFSDVEYDPFIAIVYSEKFIGWPDKSPASIVKIGNNYLLQTEAGKIYSQINSPLENLVTTYSFSKSTIRFNTYAELKDYGDEIIIERNN